MEQAKALNPNIKLYGLAWGAPGWIGGGLLVHRHDQLPGQLAGLRHLARPDHQLPRRLERARLQHLLVRAAALHPERRRLLGRADRRRRQRLVHRHRHRRQLRRSPTRSRSSACTTRAAAGRRQRRHLRGQRDRRGHRQAAVGQRERLAGPERRRARAIRSIIRGYTDAELTAYINWPLVAVHLPGPALRQRRADAGQPAVVRRLQRRARACGPPRRSPSSPRRAGSSSTPAPATSAAASPTAATSRSSPPTAPTTPRSSRPPPPPRRRPSTSTSPAACPPAPCTCGPPT